MKAKFATCRHIKTNGRVCQSPALTGGALCYFHSRILKTHRRPADAEHLFSMWQEDEIPNSADPTGEDYLAMREIYPNQDFIEFPALEDAESVQLATSMLFQALATGQIQFKRARLMIATLKIGCINQRALANSRASDADLATIQTRVVRNAQGDILAAPDEDEVEPPVAIERETSVSSAHSSNLTPHGSGPETDSKIASPVGIAPSDAPVPAPPAPNADAVSTAATSQPPSQPSTNSNEKRNLDLTHLDTGFCRQRLRSNA